MAHRGDGLSDIFEHNVIVRENCSADKFIGDGSLLTNLPGGVETDPVFTASQAANITSTDITNLGNLDSAAYEPTSTFAPAANGVTNGNSHDHSGGDGAQINHTTLSNIGTNTHAQIDTAITASSNHISDYSNPHGASVIQTLTIGNIAIPMTAGDDITAGNVVYISAANEVKAVAGSTSAILGVAVTTESNSDPIDVIVLGKVTVTCSGTVAAGDLLIGAATGKVAKFTPTTSKATGAGSSHSHTNTAASNHDHAISDGGYGANTVTGLGGGHNHAMTSESSHTHTTSSITSGEFSGGKIIGKAITGGTNTTITAFINCMG